MSVYTIFFPVRLYLRLSDGCLKGQCHEIFCFRFFSWITFPQAPDNNLRIISNFFENSRRYSQVKVHHRCQQHRLQILPPVPLVLLTPVANLPPVSTIPARFFASGFFHKSPSPKPLIITFGSFRIFSKIRGDIRKSRCTTGGKFASGIKRHRRQILPSVSLVLLTPVANLPLVSAIPAANLPPVSTTATGINDTGGKQWD